MDADLPNKAPESWEQRFVDKRHSKDRDKRPVEELFWQDIQSISSSVLQKSGTNGSASKADLGKAIQSGKLQGDEAAVGAALYNNFSYIKENGLVSNLFGQAKLSNADIASFASKGKEVEKGLNKVDNLAYWAVDSGNLKRFSPTGSLSITDIQAAQKQANLSVQDKAMLAELYADFNSIARGANSIGKTEVNSYYNKIQNAREFRVIEGFDLDMSQVEKNQKNPLAHTLFADKNNPSNSVKVDAVVQRYANDCAFKAALAGLAGSRPDEIVKMIKPNNATSKFDVQLPGTKEKTLSVAQPTAEELGLFSQHNSYGFWPTLITKAYGESVYNKADQQSKAKMNSQTDDEWAAGTGEGIAAIQALTGHQVFAKPLNKLGDTELTQRLIEGKRNNRVMVVGTPTTPDAANTTDGFRQEHAFTVTNVSNVKGNLEITIRDPQANGNNRPDGTMQISLDTLRSNFKAVYIESDKAL